jgi:hypothetical protein
LHNPKDGFLSAKYCDQEAKQKDARVDSDQSERHDRVTFGVIVNTDRQKEKHTMPSSHSGQALSSFAALPEISFQAEAIF